MTYFVSAQTVKNPENGDVLVSVGQVLTVGEFEALAKEFLLDNLKGSLCVSYEVAGAFGDEYRAL